MQGILKQNHHHTKLTSKGNRTTQTKTHETQCHRNHTAKIKINRTIKGKIKRKGKTLPFFTQLSPIKSQTTLKKTQNHLKL